MMFKTALNTIHHFTAEVFKHGFQPVDSLFESVDCLDKFSPAHDFVLVLLIV